MKTIRYPLHPGTNHRDHRYSIAREYCGDPKPRWIARFCDTWIDDASTRARALKICERHQCEQYAKMGITIAAAPVPHTRSGDINS